MGRDRKLALLLYIVLTGLVAGNLLLLQPLTVRNSASKADRSTPARTAAVPAPAADGARGKAEPKSHAPATESSELVRTLQRELTSRGYDTGSSDGVAGLMTRAAILAYEKDHNLALTAEPSERLLQIVTLGAKGADIAKLESGRAVGARGQVESVVRQVQQMLQAHNYAPGKIDGKIGDDTVRAIRDFEYDHGLEETGRISGPLVAKLSEAPRKADSAAVAPARK